MLGSLLYGSEVRSWLARDIDRLQSFVGKCVRYLVHRSCNIGLREMEARKLDMPVLRQWPGLDMIETMIVTRALGYIGHQGR